MKSKKNTVQEHAKNHFIKRAQKYNRSSKWVDDAVLIRKICDLAEAEPNAYVLDIGLGTGKIAEVFYKKVKYVVGIDICIDMVMQAKKYANKIVITSAEEMPFKDNAFDVCVSRQGLQFMEVDKVLKQIHRVLKPNGTVVLCHLTAYGEKDRDTTFLIQRLRNPARKNFFLPTDFWSILKKNNFVNTESFEYITRESVNQWIDNGAIDEEQMEKIRDVYRKASDDFKRIHNIRFKDEEIFDSMKLLIVRGTKM